MGVRVRDGEHVSEWVPTEPPVDLGKEGLAALVEEYDLLDARIKADAERRDAIKEQFKRLGRDLLLLVNGKEQFQLRADGQFMRKQFTTDHPDFAARFMRPATGEEFDLEQFKKEMPSLYKQYRADKLVRVKNSD